MPCHLPRGIPSSHKRGLAVTSVLDDCLDGLEDDRFRARFSSDSVPGNNSSCGHCLAGGGHSAFAAGGREATLGFLLPCVLTQLLPVPDDDAANDADL
jgi:hypothetical protein